MYKYEMSWTTKDGTKVEHQVFTGETVARVLKDLEQWEATDIELKLMTVEED